MSIRTFVAGSLIVAAPCAWAQEPRVAPEPEHLFDWSATYTADVFSPVSGVDGGARGVFADDLSLAGSLSLEKAIGWHGASLTGYILNNSGNEPNDRVGTLEGITNIAVARPRTRLFELYLTQDLGEGMADLKVGLMDLNANFYATETSDLLIGPAFGIGTEFSATGVNGPSIFPSSSLSLQLDLHPSDAWYARVAAFNARAGTIGDPDGVDTSFDDGALLVGEVGTSGALRLAVGGWSYTEDQDDIRDVTASGDPEQRSAHGAYVLAETDIRPSEVRNVRGFLRAGVTDGDTTDFDAALQAGVSVTRVLADRPDSALALGFRTVSLSDKAIANAADVGVDLTRGEQGLELTYADTLTPWLSLQPNVQVVRDVGGVRDAETVWIAGLRVAVSFSGAR